MEEFEKQMGGSWGDYGINNFGDIQPMEAFDYIFTVSMTTGLESLTIDDTRTKRTMQVIARMPESDLRIWASQMAASSGTEEKPKNTDYYLERARSLQNFCSRYFGGEGKKELIQ